MKAPLALETRRVVRPWMMAWLGGSILGIINGTVRELVYKNQMGEQEENQFLRSALLSALGGSRLVTQPALEANQ